MISVYVCCPYSNGDDQHPLERRQYNVEWAMRIWHWLDDTGLIAPCLPLLNHYLHEQKAKPYQHWLNLDRYWLAKCDAVLVMTHSQYNITSGMQQEIDEAHRLRIPVFESFEMLCAAYGIEP